jgi:hypothetical protein
MRVRAQHRNNSTSGRTPILEGDAGVAAIICIDDKTEKSREAFSRGLVHASVRASSCDAS